MEIFQLLVNSLNKEEARYYKLLNSIYHKEETRLDEKLFDCAKSKQADYNDDFAFNYIYGKNKKDKNSFYRLKNRIIKDISAALLVQNIDKDSFISAFQLIYLTRLFYQRNQTTLAKYYINKAEKNIIANELYELLDIVYADYLKLSLLEMDINPKEIIEKRNINAEKLNELRKIDDVLAIVNYELKTTQNYRSKNYQIIEEIEKVINSVKVSVEIKNSKRLNFKLYELVSKKILNDEDYKALEKYISKTIQKFKQLNFFDKSNHAIKLQMLTYLANSYFKNKKYEKSLKTADELLEEMNKYDKYLYDNFYFFYVNILVINYSELDKQKGIEILESLKESRIMKSTGFYDLFVYLNLSVLYFDTKEYKQAVKNISKIFQLKGYETANQELQLRIHIAELIIRMELLEYDYVLSRINQIKREFKEILNKAENSNEYLILEIILKIIKHQLAKRSKININEYIKQLSDKLKTNKGIINYFDWLTTKINL
jgi:tetratricopeptide (TPR) repeat protein